jgi:hypothetical protein
MSRESSATPNAAGVTGGTAGEISSAVNAGAVVLTPSPRSTGNVSDERRNPRHLHDMSSFDNPRFLRSLPLPSE